MKLLIDTNVLIWWMEDNPRLGRNARAMLSDPRIIIVASLVSIWEITIKWRVGKFPVSGSVHLGFLEDENVGLLEVKPEHLAALEELPMNHSDPFDHLILAQAKVEGAAIITSDREMANYGVACFPAGK